MADPRLRPAGRHFRRPRRVRKRLVALFSAVVLVIAAIVGVAAVRSVPTLFPPVQAGALGR